ncbi:hypothetical protein EJ05DRAFT_474164 [Pseudovirgaria hyperparasitica]|uniref:Zn(2)-C6 fungal-type domain-containing protein n=1 Tax=Pseudovirgaria hyperparasitica TaxID=470096 RepID=A0A6A6WGJ1_9PEZI|nr:uncharacterized protein EJ05DRAFT_474164 [Pseudovirgaria hyperparasitica]KAF2760271.1 hypothetical protein EJ05DRAFT_474164 [Pseudovirgaria hyperparasitica]
MSPESNPNANSGVDSNGKKYVRRNHRKSRAGCQNCKRRRVKCDEEKPACSNCIRFSIKCDYNPLPKNSLSPNDIVSSSPSPNDLNDTVIPRRRGRPRKNWESISAAANAKAAQDSNNDNLSTISEDPKDSRLSLASVHQHLNVEDLELLWHYIMNTSATLAGDTLGHHFYQTQAMQVAFRFSFALHFPLALAALHIARFDKSRAEHYSYVAQRHYTTGIEELTRVLPSVNSENCQGLYVASVLVSIYTFAMQPRPGDFLIFNDVGGLSLWLPLLRGVRSIITTAGSQAIFSGVLAPVTNNVPGSPAGTRLAMKRPRSIMPWRTQIAELGTYIESSTDPVLTPTRRALFGRALEGMQPSFASCYADSAAELASPAPNESATVMIWFYHMDPDFVACLQDKEPLALIILSYFTVLMKTMEDRWFMRGWVEHILSGIKKSVDARYSGWLRWPMEVAGVGEGRMDISYVTASS